jgi:hypothetical protein
MKKSDGNACQSETNINLKPNFKKAEKNILKIWDGGVGDAMKIV